MFNGQYPAPHWPCASTRVLTPVCQHSSFELCQALNQEPSTINPPQGVYKCYKCYIVAPQRSTEKPSATQVLQTAAKCYISCCKCYNRPLRPLPFHSEI